MPFGTQVDGDMEAGARLLGPSKSKHVMSGQPALQSLLRAEVIEEVMPIHNPAFLKTLVPKVWTPFPQAIQIQQYYGDAVALYFAWMVFMCKWLAVPGLLGIATFAIHQITGANANCSHLRMYSYAAICMSEMHPAALLQRTSATRRVLHW